MEVNKVVPNKLIEFLNKVIAELHGPFQVTLIVNTHTGQMNEMIKNELVKLFAKFNSYAMTRYQQINLINELNFLKLFFFK